MNDCKCGGIAVNLAQPTKFSFDFAFLTVLRRRQIFTRWRPTIFLNFNFVGLGKTSAWSSMSVPFSMFLLQQYEWSLRVLTVVDSEWPTIGSNRHVPALKTFRYPLPISVVWPVYSWRWCWQRRSFASKIAVWVSVVAVDSVHQKWWEQQSQSV